MEIKCICPNCGREIVLKADIQLNDWLICPHCDIDLVVVNLKPPTPEIALYGPEMAGLPYRMKWREYYY